MSPIRGISDSQMPGRTPKASVSMKPTHSFQEKAEAFYSWYQSIRQHTFPPEGFHYLQCIMQIGQKNTATQEEAELANENLSTLIEAWEGGKKTLDQIPNEIKKILDDLTQNNPKSRIIMQVTQVEIAINLFQVPPSKELKKLMKRLLKRVSLEMSRTQALEISRLLEKEIKPHSCSKSLKGKLSSLLD